MTGCWYGGHVRLFLRYDSTVGLFWNFRIAICICNKVGNYGPCSVQLSNGVWLYFFLRLTRLQGVAVVWWFVVNRLLCWSLVGYWYRLILVGLDGSVGMIRSLLRMMLHNVYVFDWVSSRFSDGLERRSIARLLTLVNEIDCKLLLLTVNGSDSFWFRNNAISDGIIASQLCTIESSIVLSH